MNISMMLKGLTFWLQQNAKDVEGSICETDVNCAKQCDSVPMYFKLCRKNIGGLEECSNTFFPPLEDI